MTDIADHAKTQANLLEQTIAEQVMSIVGPNLAYIRTSETDDGIEYIVFATDGTRLASFSNSAEAYYTALEHDLQPVSVH